MCDGEAVSRTVYAELFAVIGTTYGTGDGSTTFNVPNLCGRVGIGSNGTYALGSTGGEAEHILTSEEMPLHNHIIKTALNGESHDFSANLVSSSGYDYGSSWTGGDPLAGSSEPFTQGRGTDPVGGSQPHNNMQPYTVVNYIISTGLGALDTAEIIGGVTTLPLGIEHGGLGATSKEVALQNLGVNDYIVAQGTSGNWTWQKWDSGVAKCWGLFDETINCNISWGSLYESSGYKYDYPFSFISPPTEVVGIKSNSGFFIEYYLWNSNTSTATFAALRSTSVTGAASTFSINVVGRWK